jgi:hypothetical protein
MVEVKLLPVDALKNGVCAVTGRSLVGSAHPATASTTSAP